MDSLFCNKDEHFVLVYIDDNDKEHEVAKYNEISEAFKHGLDYEYPPTEWGCLGVQVNRYENGMFSEHFQVKSEYRHEPLPIPECNPVVEWIMRNKEWLQVVGFLLGCVLGYLYFIYIHY